MRTKQTTTEDMNMSLDTTKTISFTAACKKAPDQ